MNTVKNVRYSNRGASHVQSELFWAIRELSGQINCPVLDQVVSADIYKRSKLKVVGIKGELVSGYITDADLQLRTRIVDLIGQSMISDSPFRMSLEQYAKLKELVRLYQLFSGRQKILESEEYMVRDVISDVRPNFYPSKPLEQDEFRTGNYY